MINDLVALIEKSLNVTQYFFNVFLHFTGNLASEDVKAAERIEFSLLVSL